MLVGDGISAMVYADDNGAFTLNVHTLGTGPDGRRVYDYAVFRDGALLTSGEDLYSGVGDAPNARRALGTLISFLSADADRYRRLMGPVPDGCEDYSFSTQVAEWAYMNSDELAMIGCELGDD